MLEPKTTAITQITRFTDGGQAVPTLVIEYRIGDHGPFRIEVSKVDATKEHIRELQQKDVDIVNALMPE